MMHNDQGDWELPRDESCPIPGVKAKVTTRDYIEGQPGPELSTVQEGSSPLDVPQHFYVSITPGGIKLKYAGSVRTKGELAFYQVYFGMYGPEYNPHSVEAMKHDFKTRRRNVYAVHTLGEYLGDHVRRHRGKWVALKD